MRWLFLGEGICWSGCEYSFVSVLLLGVLSCGFTDCHFGREGSVKGQKAMMEKEKGKGGEEEREEDVKDVAR